MAGIWIDPDKAGEEVAVEEVAVEEGDCISFYIPYWFSKKNNIQNKGGYGGFKTCFNCLYVDVKTEKAIKLSCCEELAKANISFIPLSIIDVRFLARGEKILIEKEKTDYLTTEEREHKAKKKEDLILLEKKIKESILKKYIKKEGLTK